MGAGRTRISMYQCYLSFLGYPTLETNTASAMSGTGAYEMIDQAAPQDLEHAEPCVKELHSAKGCTRPQRLFEKLEVIHFFFLYYCPISEARFVGHDRSSYSSSVDVSLPPYIPLSTAFSILWGNLERSILGTLRVLTYVPEALSWPYVRA